MHSPIRPPGIVDASPLLTYSLPDNLLRSHRLLRRSPPPLRGAASRLLRRASGRRMMLREQSVRVRETAAEHLEEQQSDWAYSKPIIFLDLLWNLAFVIIAVVVLCSSTEEKPQVPLRLWIVGYALQCLLHVLCVVLEYRRRREGRVNVVGDSGSGSGSENGDSEDYEQEELQGETVNSSVKNMEFANTMFSFTWWVLGFYWISAGSETLIRNSPQLYWLCVTFLAFEVVFVVICVAVACLVGIAVCCCLPCILAILYALRDQEGATKDDVNQLPKYRFFKMGDFEKETGEVQESSRGIMIGLDTDTPTELVLSLEDAECCICLSAYDHGSELRELPCHHHFHSGCIDKWLYINATCPLCKLNILKTVNCNSCEEV